MALGADAGTPDDEPPSGFVERAAWRLFKRSSRRFFVVLAVSVAGVVVLVSVFTAVIAARNAAAVASARDQGEQVATSITEFQEHLSQANDEFAISLVSREPQSEDSRARYDEALLASSLALTRAGLNATGRDAKQIDNLATDLDAYANLVVTSRPYPVGTRFYRDARAMARDLADASTDIRESAQHQISGAADGVEGGRTWAASLAMWLVALPTLLIAAALVAGRTRIRLHPAIVAAVLLLIGELYLATYGLWTERTELQRAADAEFEAYTDTQEAATTIFAMRTAETDALARLDDDSELRAEFEAGAEHLPEGIPGTLPGAVSAYADSVVDVQGQTRDAAVEATVEGGSAIAYRNVRGLAVSLVDRSTSDLRTRLDKAADAGVAWPVPVLLGVGAAVLGAGGVLRRGQAYLGWSA